MTQREASHGVGPSAGTREDDDQESPEQHPEDKIMNQQEVWQSQEDKQEESKLMICEKPVLGEVSHGVRV